MCLKILLIKGVDINYQWQIIYSLNSHLQSLTGLGTEDTMWKKGKSVCTGQSRVIYVGGGERQILTQIISGKFLITNWD